MKNKELYEEIGIRMRMEREARGYTQEKMAEALELSENYYGKIERGQRYLSIDTLLLLYTKFDIDIMYILTGERSCNYDYGLQKIFNDIPDSKRNEVQEILYKIVKLIKNNTENCEE